MRHLLIRKARENVMQTEGRYRLEQKDIDFMAVADEYLQDN